MGGAFGDNESGSGDVTALKAAEIIEELLGDFVSELCDGPRPDSVVDRRYVCCGGGMGVSWKASRDRGRREAEVVDRHVTPERLRLVIRSPGRFTRG